MAIFVGLYLAVHRQLAFLKEVVVALLYSAGILLPSLSVTPESLSSFHYIMIILFFNTALVNLLLFSWFDLKQAREMMTVLRHEAAQGRTLLLSIHQLADAERICDRFVLLSAGEVRGVGTLDELRARINAPHAGLEEVFLALA